jgi:two-component system, NarL family, nitrate/nitrite response regulator NarL
MLETVGGCWMPHHEKIGTQSLWIVSEIKLLREGIAGVVDGHPVMRVAGSCETLEEALAGLRNYPDTTVLLDGSFPGGLDAIREIHVASPLACVIVFAVSETEENIVAWAKADAAGYIPASTALNELANFIESVSRGEQICSAAIASRLIRRLRAPPTASEARRPASVVVSLTSREKEFIRMLAEGMSNKEIARNLHIELSTTKTHVHNLLGKLGLKRRGQIASWSRKQERPQ